MRTLRELESKKELKDCQCFPLHGELPPQQQDAAVESSGQRKVIVATNVAETSITIDGITHVVDSGLARVAKFDPRRGINTLLIEKISQASADQRAGRAGRTAPGTCLRLWLEEDHPNRPAYETPEIHRVDLAESILTLKGAGIEDMAGLDWVEPPIPESMERALTLLEDLSALDHEQQLTGTGKRMLAFPTHPRFARLLLEAERLSCVRAAALVAACAGERDLLIRKVDKRVRELREDILGDVSGSDFFMAFRAFRFAVAKKFDRNACSKLGIHGQTARQIERAHNQFLRIAESSGLQVEQEAPSDETIRKCILAAFADQLAIRLDGGSFRCRVIHGRKGSLAKETVVRESPLVVAAEISEIEGQDRLNVLLSKVTAVEEQWLRELDPEGFHEGEDVTFDEFSQRVVARKFRMFRDLVLEETVLHEVPEEKAGELLAQQVLDGSLKLRNWDEKVEQWMIRLNNLAEWMPELELPPIGKEEKLMLLTQICTGAKSAKRLKDQEVWPVIHDWLSEPQRQALEAYAPERYLLKAQTPRGERERRIRIEYQENAAPVLGAKIQELYEIKEPLTIAGGKVRLKIEVLAPNNRPVQVTDDLGNFWNEMYPKLKVELKRRYPKHVWK